MKMKKYKVIIAAALVILALFAAFCIHSSVTLPITDPTGEKPVISQNTDTSPEPDTKIAEIQKDGGEKPETEQSEKATEQKKTDEPKEQKKATPAKQDKYKTSPVPEGKPAPVEPQSTEVTEEELTCTLSVRCDTILKNIGKLDPEKIEILPKDGVIFAERTVVFYDGESVFNLLSREMKKNKIHMEFVNTPIYNSAYIEGIGNLYEFDCGELSGWMYRVNGWFPNYGCSRYKLKKGDRVEWVYTCDLGTDVGGGYSAGVQKEE